MSIPISELTFRFSRSSGPGGQNVNKRETQVELVFDVRGSSSLGPRLTARVVQRLASRLDASGLLHIVASDERSQSRNREIALERFRELMRDALAPPPPRRRKTRPSRSARERRLAEKKHRGRLKRQRSNDPDG